MYLKSTLIGLLELATNGASSQLTSANGGRTLHSKRSFPSRLVLMEVSNRCTLCLVLLLFLLTSFAVAQARSPQTRIVPNDGWVKTYFKSIDDLTKRVGLKPLRLIAPQPGDLEVRIWSGFGLQGLGCRIIKRVGNIWSSAGMYDSHRTLMIDGHYVEPNLEKAPDTIEWPVIWEKMEHAGIFDIRDDSEIPHCSRTLDGHSYVVEIARSDFYRTYLVGNPQFDRSEDGDKFLRVMSVLQKAFGNKSRDELADLPVGEEKIVGALSSDTSGSGKALDGHEYTVGEIPQESSIVHLPTEEVLAQGISLHVPECQEWSNNLLRRIQRVSAKVVVELFIRPDGTVSAARALYGPSLLAVESLQAAMKWKFIPLTNSNEIRSTVVSLLYEQKWVQFPWIK
jgi:hypothetical protein